MRHRRPHRFTLESAFGSVQPSERIPEDFDALTRDGQGRQGRYYADSAGAARGVRFLDTIIIIRYLTRDHEVKARACYELLPTGRAGLTIGGANHVHL